MSRQNSHKIETTPMFIVGWMGKHSMICTYSGILFSLVKKEIPMNPTLMNVEYMLNEISQSQKDKYCIIPHLCLCFIETERMVISRD